MGLKSKVVRTRVEVEGVVQGVGFRPFVYRTAKELGLTGFVLNSSRGVEIEVEGAGSAVMGFLENLENSPPPLARITSVKTKEIPTENSRAFIIALSQDTDRKRAHVSPDVAVCRDCLREMRDPADPRFRYPFINCTNCGPRYTIIMDVPYDRPFTTMAVFEMCEVCAGEYHDPLNRRFHAQPVCCPGCGPGVWLANKEGEEIVAKDPVAETIRLLEHGRIVAIKGLGGFHLAVDAGNEDAVLRLRSRKLREEKPLAVMARDIDAAREISEPTEDEAELLLDQRRPIVLVKKRAGSKVSEQVAPNNRYLGVMLPYTPLHHLLMEGAFPALVMTSGNLSEEPIAIDNGEGLKRLGNIADFFLLHDRDIYLRADDSVVMFAGGRERPLRRSRGWAPAPLKLPFPAPPLLAVGAMIKNTVLVARGQDAFLSQHIGDLENIETYHFLVLTVQHPRRIFDVAPEVAVADLHPDYLSTRYAGSLDGVRLIRVAHHHAHAASCMAENGLEGPCLALTLDGMGLGTDGTAWGGELLLAEYATFRRLGHLTNVPLIGGDMAAREPWRMALSWLIHAYGPELPKAEVLKRHREKLPVLLKMVEKGVNTPPTTSLGRLYDGAAAILGIRDAVSFEGQAAMELEMAARGVSEPYPFEVKEEGEMLKADPAGIIRGLSEDVERGRDVSEIAGSFQTSVVEMFSEMTRLAGERTGLSRVALSGGCFQNRFLLENFTHRLKGLGFEVFTHTEVPANDGGLPLGQAAVAAAIIARERKA